MSKKLAKEGYNIKATQGGYQRLLQEYPYQFTAVKDSHGMPEGFVPGAGHCEEKGYNYGSEITTRDGKMFKCVDPTSRKAKWVEIQTEITDQSYSEQAQQQPDDESTSEKETSPAADTSTEEDETVNAAQEDLASMDTPIDQMGDIPYVGFIKKNENINTLGDLITEVKEGRVNELGYLNENRAQKVVMHLKAKGYV